MASELSDRTPRCDRLHPGEDAEIRYYSRTLTPYKFRSCAKCMRIAALMRKRGQQTETQSSARGPYGVLPRLTWAPPEGALQQNAEV